MATLQANAPGKYKPKINTRSIYEQVLGTLFFSFIIYIGIAIFINHDIKFKFVLLGTSVIVLIINILAIKEEKVNRIKNYERNLEEYEIELRQYPDLVEKTREINNAELKKFEMKQKKYLEDLRIYEEHINEINRPVNLQNYRKTKLIERLKEVTLPNKVVMPQKVIVGVCENSFLQELRKELSYTILKDCVLNFETDGGYYPDITIHDPKTNLHIDIEIDEPYVGATGEPIHYIGCNDENRDDFFLTNGWIVVRFAEKQIVDHTAQCIELIKYIIHLIFNNAGVDDGTSLDKLFRENLKSEFCVSQWSKDLAHKMAFTRYRNGYLGYELSEKLPTEILSNEPNASRSRGKKNNYSNNSNEIDDLPF